MSILWGDYRVQIRRSVLKDELLAQWSDEQLLDYTCWAMDTFAAHTAYTTEWILDAESNALLSSPYDLDVDTAFDLPTNMYDSISFEGAVSIDYLGKTYHLDPLNRTPGMHPYATVETPYFYEWPSRKLNISAPVTSVGSLKVRYFSYYPHPATFDDDSAEILLPQWALQPVSFLVGSYALAALAIQSANIDRWKDRTDSGNPEQNALRAQQEYMFKQYERGIARFPGQDRVNYFRQFTTGSDQW